MKEYAIKATYYKIVLLLPSSKYSSTFAIIIIYFPNLD